MQAADRHQKRLIFLQQKPHLSKKSFDSFRSKSFHFPLQEKVFSNYRQKKRKQARERRRKKLFFSFFHQDKMDCSPTKRNIQILEYKESPFHFLLNFLTNKDFLYIIGIKYFTFKGNAHEHSKSRY